METIGKRLKYYMKIKDTSVNEMAERTGIPQPSIYRILNSDSGLNSSTLASIINMYPELNIKWLVTGIGNYMNEDIIVNNVQENYVPYNNDNTELKSQVKALLSNDVIVDFFVDILKKHDKQR